MRQFVKKTKNITIMIITKTISLCTSNQPAPHIYMYLRSHGAESNLNRQLNSVHQHNW